MIRTVKATLAALLLWPITLGLASAADDAFDLGQVDEGGYVVMLRHALAPGTGDPARFTLGDCSTQRTLSEEGRDQARAIGQRLRQAGISKARVFSSQWCRCLSTAALLGLGQVEELPALNSFYGPNRPMRAKRLSDLRAFLADQPTDGPLIILVTHQVTVSAITGTFVSSGGAKVLKLDGSEAPKVVGAF